MSSAKPTIDQQKKIAKKNILLSPFQLEWPNVDSTTEDKILGTLISKLEEFPSLELQRKRGGCGSRVKKETEADDENNNDLVRKRLRLQLALGHRQVSKGLERDSLALVLVWRGAQPPLVVKSLLPLAATRACPALCLDRLVPTVTQATGLSSLVAMGFLKSQPGLDDFASFVSMATKLAPPLPVPWLTSGKSAKKGKSKKKEQMGKGDNSEAETKSGGDETKSGEGAADTEQADWPLLSSEQEKQLMEKLKGVLDSYKDMFKNRKPRFRTDDWRERRKTIRRWIVTDLVAIDDAVKSGRLAMLLVQADSELPNVSMTTVARRAVQKGCPVLGVSGLKRELSGLVRNPVMSALGFRIESNKTDFEEFVTFVKQFLPSTQPRALTAKQQMEKDDKNKFVQKKTPIPVYDVSHLYVYKTQSSQDGATLSDSKTEEKPKRKVVLSEETEQFISLSAEPTVKFIGLGSTFENAPSAQEALPLFIDKKGTAKDPATRKTGGKKRKPELEEKRETGSMMGVMGLESSLVSPVVASESFDLEPGRPVSGKKAGLKRKLASDADVGEFVSFKLAPTNVQTCLANPNKKRRKKKNKR